MSFRIPLILAVFLALSCTAIGVAADTPTVPTVSQRTDGRLLPDGADIHPTTASGRPDGRIVPDAVDAHTANLPVVIRVNESHPASFDWLAALIGALAVAGVALAVGGLVVIRHQGPTPAAR